MRVFIDTSSLFKKYVEESGSDKLEEMLLEASEIAVSPLTWIEFNSAISRRLTRKVITSQQASWLRSEAEKDFLSYHRVVWNGALEARAVRLVRENLLTTLDAIQLASGILSESKFFITSDQGLYQEARKIHPHARFI